MGWGGGGGAGALAAAAAAAATSAAAAAAAEVGCRDCSTIPVDLLYVITLLCDHPPCPAPGKPKRLSTSEVEGLIWETAAASGWGGDNPLVQGLRRGIGIHHGGLPKMYRQVRARASRRWGGSRWLAGWLRMVCKCKRCLGRRGERGSDSPPLVSRASLNMNLNLNDPCMLSQVVEILFRAGHLRVSSGWVRCRAQRSPAIGRSCGGSLAARTACPSTAVGGPHRRPCVQTPRRHFPLPSLSWPLPSNSL